MKPAASVSRPRRLRWGAALLLLSATTGRAGSLLETMDQEVAALYQKSRDAIVKVHAQRAVTADNWPLAPIHRVGTGFFVDGAGHLLTSATVVSDATACWIDWRGDRVPARLLGRDPLTNVALLQVDPEKCVGPGHPTPFLACGNSDDLKVGSMIIAIGFPYDLPSSPSVGFVNGIDIKCGTHTFITSHVRAGCRLQPGQGGGPMLNARGEVVGLAVAAHLEDQCYVLPINAARKVAADILEQGAPQYGWVGLSVTERAPGALTTTTAQWEVFVQEIYSNTPAATAGFRERDLLLAIQTNEIHRAADVLNTMFHCRRGDRLCITVLRDGQRQQIRLVVGQRPAEETDAAPRLVLPPAAPRPPTIAPVAAPAP